MTNPIGKKAVAPVVPQPSQKPAHPPASTSQAPMAQGWVPKQGGDKAAAKAELTRAILENARKSEGLANGSIKPEAISSVADVLNQSLTKLDQQLKSGAIDPIRGELQRGILENARKAEGLANGSIKAETLPSITDDLKQSLVKLDQQVKSGAIDSPRGELLRDILQKALRSLE